MKLLGVTLAIACLAATGCSEDKNRSGIRGIAQNPAKQVGEIKIQQRNGMTPAPLTGKAGEYKLVYFGYTSCPDVCPTSIADLRKAVAQTPPLQRKSLTPVFISVDPDRDTTTKMKDYMKLFFKKFQVVRPEQQSLEAAERAFGADSKIEKQGKKYTVSHSAYIYLVDPKGRIVVEWPFQTPPQDIAHDLKQVVK